MSEEAIQSLGTGRIWGFFRGFYFRERWWCVKTSSLVSQCEKGLQPASRGQEFAEPTTFRTAVTVEDDVALNV